MPNITSEQIVICAKCDKCMDYVGWNEWDQAHIWSIYQCECGNEVYITEMPIDDPHHPTR
jgi:hypothetical protein